MKKLFTLLLLAVAFSAYCVNVTFTVHYDGELTKDTMFIVGDMTADEGGGWQFQPMIDLGDGSYTWSTALESGDTLGYYYITVNSWDSAGNQDWSYYTRYREYPDTSECPAKLIYTTDRKLIVPNEDTVITDYWGECPGYEAPLGIYKENPSQEFIVFPNPSKGLVNLDLSLFDLETSIEVLDLTGKVLLRSNSVANNLNLDLSGLPSSIYIIKASDGKMTQYKKILLK
jgi:hypothetical protein